MPRGHGPLAACAFLLCCASPGDAHRADLSLSLSPADEGSAEAAPVEQQGQHQTPGANVTVRIYWMRHGLSCANVIREFSLMGLLTQHTYKDPSLTDCAIQHAAVLGSRIRDAMATRSENWTSPLMVFSSVLVRAMETALYNFPGESVYPIPFVAEDDRYADNMPFEWEEQHEKKLMRPPNTRQLINHLAINNFVNPSKDPDRDGEHKNDYAMFKREFPKMLSILLPEENVRSGAVIPAVIVSHSGYMRRNLRCLGNQKPYNNEVWVKDYSVQLLSASQLCGASGGPCQRGAAQAPAMDEVDDACGPALLGRAAYPRYQGIEEKGYIFNKKYVCEKDIARCSARSFFMPKRGKSVSCCEDLLAGAGPPPG